MNQTGKWIGLTLLASHLFVFTNANAFDVASQVFNSENSEATCKLTTQLTSKKPGYYIETLCGATLIGPNLLLTAAHCVEDFRASSSNPITVQCPKEQNTLFGVQVAFPLDWIGENASNDFALIRLSEKARNTKPMQVATNTETVSEALRSKCFLSGYGPTEENSDDSGKLHTSEVKDLKYSTMATKTQKGTVIQTKNKYSWINHGDSGGSVFCKKESERPTLIGVISMTQTSKFEFLAWGFKKEVALFAPTTNLSWALKNIDLLFQ